MSPNTTRMIDDTNLLNRISNPTLVSTRRRNLYRGFSTVNTYGRSFALTDIELVKRDIMNHIYTIPGERIHNPGFGTLIPVVAFEQADKATLDLIERELRRVAASDPRVELVNIAVMAVPDDNAIVAIMDLKYIELDGQIDSLSITVNNG